MPGRTPQEAFEAFVSPLREALACVAKAKISVSPGGRTVTDKEHALYLNKAENVSLRGSTALELGVRMRYKIIADPGNGPYRVTTLAYDHLLIRSSGEAVLNFHWHPGGASHEETPHVHVGSSQLARDAVLTNKIHVPTGRISVERVIRTAIELGVDPLADDWDRRLEQTEAPFVAYRTWG